MAAADPHEADLLRVLRGEFGHVSAERVVSGPGLVNLYRAHCQLSSVEPEPLDAASIVQRARSQQDAACVQTVRCFVGLLGGFVGNQALSFGAQGGVYLAGGVLPHLGDLFDAQLFRRHFEAKGRYRAYLKSIPVWTIIDPCIALRGALAALE